ncbi:hypothetical protein POTOM_008931 [Populus tomentosa]|uniref:Uncharacterized protein n=1 Tax=Populus tomentosa TaxID=118781 RepID=A0A8X8AI97_POPTO|nr:hypothetical protein POTOM_008931 [Populus tomentosa]
MAKQWPAIEGWKEHDTFGRKRDVEACLPCKVDVWPLDGLSIINHSCLRRVKYFRKEPIDSNQIARMERIIVCNLLDIHILILNTWNWLRSSQKLKILLVMIWSEIFESSENKCYNCFDLSLKIARLSSIKVQDERTGTLHLAGSHSISSARGLHMRRAILFLLPSTLKFAEMLQPIQNSYGQN